MSAHQKRRNELTRRIEACETYIDECSEPGPRRSGAIWTMERLREERDAMDRDQSDLIAAVLDFARKLTTETPPHLGGPWAGSDESNARLLERERVGAQLLRLLEDSGIDVHEEEP